MAPYHPASCHGVWHRQNYCFGLPMVIWLCRGRGTQAAAHGLGGRLGARMHVELGEDVGDVRIRGAMADEEHRPDLPVGRSLRQQPEDLDFSFCQFVVAATLRFSPGSEERGFSQSVRDELIEWQGQTFRPGVVECVLRE